MREEINAEIISIGTEILLGDLTDTNSVFIARTLRDLGINVYYMTSVGDNRQRIANAIRIALSRAQVVITCGGLGPTVDDMTRQAVADATERGLVFHQSLLDQIAERFAGFKVKMTENNRQQAYLPENATVIENPVGTAPSFAVEHGEGVVISLPGVPREMKFLMGERVVPYLRDKYKLGIIKARILKAAGIGESALDELLGHDLLESGNPTVGLAAHHGQIDIRVTAKADTEAEADIMIAGFEEIIRARVGEYVFGVNEDVLEKILVEMLLAQGGQLAVVQAGFDDVISGALAGVEGGAQVLRLAERYAHPDEALAAYNIAPETSMREAAQTIAQRIGADVRAAVVILGDPDVDETSDNVENTVLTVYTPDETRARYYGFGGRNEIGRSWVTRWALSSIWRMLRSTTQKT
ncbi:MAG: CinA family nicotinamide mononucleotide deamidase-related protein [Anaerolineae bacterium]